MPRIRRSTTRRDRSHAHEERSHTGATSLAGDASKAQAEALHDQQHLPRIGADSATSQPKSSTSDPSLFVTGPITKIARIFGASVVVAVVGATAAAPIVNARDAAADTAVAPHSLLGPDAPTLIGPAPATDYVAVTANRAGNGAWLLEPDGQVRPAGRARTVVGASTNPVTNPAVDVATAQRGIWVLAARGRITPRGGAVALSLPPEASGAVRYVALGAQPTGTGAFALRSDGRVFALGSAVRRGDAAGDLDGEQPVDIASTPSGSGYYIVTDHGRVFAYGDARFVGDPHGFVGPDVVGIVPDDDGRGYWIAFDTGAVISYRAGAQRSAFAPASGVAVVAVTEHPGGAPWTLQGAAVDHMHPFLVCTRSHESSHTPPAYDDGYDAVNPSGKYRGAYQFARSTWDSTARHAGRPDLVGVDPAAAVVIDQDTLALHLYRWQGADPWLGRCAGL